MSTTTFMVLATLSLAVLTVHAFSRRRHRLPFPPGPPPLPVIGNAHQMTLERPWIAFTCWAAEYGEYIGRFIIFKPFLMVGTGEIVHLSVLGQHIIILNSPEAVGDLLNRRSAIYSDRPSLPMAGELYVQSPSCGSPPHSSKGLVMSTPYHFTLTTPNIAKVESSCWRHFHLRR